MEAALTNEIFTTVKRIQDLVQVLASTINAALSGLSFLLGWIADRVHDAWDWFMGKMSEFWDWLTNILTNMGDGDALTRTADAWSNDVAAPVSKEVGLADLGTLLVDDNWQGKAAGMYKSIVPLQKLALDKIKTNFADGISLSLGTLRSAIMAFKTSIVVALAALIAGLIGAIASSATVFGLPAAPFIAGGAALVASAAIYFGVTTLQSASALANSTLRQKLADNSGYPGGNWPVGVLH